MYQMYCLIECIFSAERFKISLIGFVDMNDGTLNDDQE